MGRTIADDQVIAEVVGSIRGVLQPWRIVLFGSRARGDHREWSDYDFYVEVAEAESLRDVHDRIRRALPKGSSFDIKVRARGTIERRRDDPGTIEWDVAREGRILFADPDAAVGLKPTGRVAESPPGVPDSLREWLETAESDLHHCELLRRQTSGFAPEICWLSHQMSEKYLKALLVSRRVRPARTHKLMELLVAARTARMPLPGLDADCELLTTHAIEPRYPAGLCLTSTDAERAFSAAERIVAAVRAELSQG